MRDPKSLQRARQRIIDEAMRIQRTIEETKVRLICSVLVNSDNLTANYDVKQNQFTKLTSEPRASDPNKSNETFDCAIRG